MKKANNKKAGHKNTTLLSTTNNEQTIIRKKIPSWAEVEGLEIPSRLSLEQCSSERTAIYKGNIVRRLFPNGGTKMADLTGGFGVDFSFVARHFKEAIYIERQAALCEAARHNFPLLNICNAEIIERDGTEQLPNLPIVDLIFMDPARRDQIGRKTVLIEDCEPNVIALLPTLWKKTKFIILKLSPMLDLTRAIKSLEKVGEAHIVSDGGECKELLLVLKAETTDTTIFCADGNNQISFQLEDESTANVSYTSSVKTYLYEPNASLLKAGAFKWVGQHYQLEKLHVNSHLYTSDNLISNFPGRTFMVKQVCSFSKKDLKSLCNSVDRANLTIRNFPGTVAELRKRMKLKEGGDAYWFATTLADNKHVIIDCRKASAE